MPKQLVNLSVASPAFFGLNKQNGGAVLPAGWASEAMNLVFDENGRAASRKGYKSILTSNPTGTPKVIHEYIDGTGSSVTIFVTNSTIYKDDGDGTITDISGSATVGGDNWQFVNFSGSCIGFRDGDLPITLTTAAEEFVDLNLTGTTVPTTAADNVCAAFGRLWTIDGTDLKYSGLLLEGKWSDGGDGGVFDLGEYWKGGMDNGTTVAEYNGHLVVFGKDNIIIYGNPFDLATMQIVENIGGIGCVARDSVQDIGTDLLFLSRTGVRSLGRTIQEKSMPVRDVSKNIKQYLTTKYSTESGDIKSIYNSEEGFYALSFPSNSTTFVFDLKGTLEDGSSRVTEWDIAPTAMGYTQAGSMYVAFTTRLGEYTGYKDDVARDGTGGDSYDINWIGGWNDFGQEVASFLKIPKKLSVLMGGISNVSVTAKWAFDYLDSFHQATVTFSGGSAARYGVAHYNTAGDVYSGLLTFESVKAPLTSSGQVIKFGVQATVSGEQVVLQRLDLLTKIGRYSL